VTVVPFSPVRLNHAVLYVADPDGIEFEIMWMLPRSA